VASVYVILRKLSGNRRNPRINNSSTAETGSARAVKFVGNGVVHEVRLLSKINF
jgi:hypothetical protein